MKKRISRIKVIAFALRMLAVAAFIGFPVWAVAEKFPLWKTRGGDGAALGVGGVLLLIVLFVTFKKYVVAWAAEKLGTISAGVSLVLLWFGAAIVCITLAKIAGIMEDLATVFLWSAVGAGIGVVLQFTARKVSEIPDVEENEPREKNEGDVTNGTDEGQHE